MDTYLITGGSGFIGSHFIRCFLKERQGFLVNLDLLTYATHPLTLQSVEKHPCYHFIQGDIADPRCLDEVFSKFSFRGILNFAAETHVDRSIACASAFIHSNIEGVYHLLEKARKTGVEYFLQISTDEVYGSIPAPCRSKENAPLAPSNPYAASKASADLLVQSYFRTYQLDTRISRCCNNYGSYQFPEKLIPLFITRLLKQQKVPLYGKGLQVREWIRVEDHIQALFQVMDHGKAGEIYHISSNEERSNLEMTRLLLKILEKEKSEESAWIEYVPDRLGHDYRYALEPSRLQEKTLGASALSLEKGLEDVVEWYQEQREWWDFRA
jgi:dTDP-glucose 4,6-dehydratase